MDEAAAGRFWGRFSKASKSMALIGVQKTGYIVCRIDYTYSLITIFIHGSVFFLSPQAVQQHPCLMKKVLGLISISVRPNSDRQTTTLEVKPQDNHASILSWFYPPGPIT
jgi:hypothetical protein